MLIWQQRISRSFTHAGVLEVQEQITADRHITLTVIFRIPLMAKLVDRAPHEKPAPPIIKILDIQPLSLTGSQRCHQQDSHEELRLLCRCGIQEPVDLSDSQRAAPAFFLPDKIIRFERVLINDFLLHCQRA